MRESKSRGGGGTRWCGTGGVLGRRVCPRSLGLTPRCWRPWKGRTVMRALCRRPPPAILPPRTCLPMPPVRQRRRTTGRTSTGRQPTKDTVASMWARRRRRRICLGMRETPRMTCRRGILRGMPHRARMHARLWPHRHPPSRPQSGGGTTTEGMWRRRWMWDRLGGTTRFSRKRMRLWVGRQGTRSLRW